MVVGGETRSTCRGASGRRRSRFRRRTAGALAIQRQISHRLTCSLNLLAQSALIQQHLFHDLRVDIELGSHLLLMRSNGPDLSKQEIQILHEMLVTCIFLRGMLIHLREHKLSLHRGLRGRRGDRTASRTPVTRLEKTSEGARCGAKPTENSDHTTKPTNYDEMSTVAPIIETQK